MAVPKQRQNKARRGRRRAGQLNKLKKTTSMRICDNCQRKIASHRACPHCGYYKGKKVLDIK